MLHQSDEFYFSSPVGEINLTLPSNLDHDLDNYESGLISDLVRELPDNGVFYDVGAYVGYITKSIINCEVSTSQIHSFEGLPFRYYVLEENCGSAGINTVNKYVAENTSENTISIDDYSKSNPSPDIVKIDVEGHEYEVLNGMTDSIYELHPTLYVEIHPELLNDLGYSEAQTLQLLHDSGYELMFMQHRKNEAIWQDEPVYDESTASPTYMLRAKQ